MRIWARLVSALRWTVTPSSGAGAMGNRSIGTAAAGGMLFGTIFGVLMVPGLYVLFESIGSRMKQKKMLSIPIVNEHGVVWY